MHSTMSTLFTKCQVVLHWLDSQLDTWLEVVEQDKERQQFLYFYSLGIIFCLSVQLCGTMSNELPRAIDDPDQASRTVRTLRQNMQ